MERMEFEVLGKGRADFGTLQAQLDNLGRKLDELGRKHVTPELDLEEHNVKAQIDEITAKLDALGAVDATPAVDLQIGDFQSQLAVLQAELDRISAERVQVHADVDIGDALAHVEALKASFAGLTDKKTKIDVDIQTALAEIQRLIVRLDELRSKEASVKVDADIAAAEAKLEALRVRLASLADKKLNVDIDSSSVDKATSSIDKASGSMGRMQIIAVALAALFPAIATAILAVPAALELIAAPIAAVVVGMDGIKKAFEQLDVPINAMKASVSAAFTNGLQPSIVNIAEMLPTLTNGLTGTAQSISQIALGMTNVVTSSAGLSQLSQSFSLINQLLSSMAPGIAIFTSNILNLAAQGLQGFSSFAAVFQQVATNWQTAIATMSQTGTVQAAVNGLVQVFGALLNALIPVVQIGASLMGAIGPPLAGALQAVGAVLGPLASLFASLPGPIQTLMAVLVPMRLLMSNMGKDATTASDGIRKVGDSAGTSAPRFAGLVTAMTGIRTAFQEAGAGSEGATTKLGAFASSAAKVGAAVTSGLGSALKGITSALGGPWGIAILAATLGLSQIAENNQKAAQSVTSFTDALRTSGGIVDDNVQKLIQTRIQGLGPLEGAAQSAGVSMQDMFNAVSQGGPKLDEVSAKIEAQTGFWGFLGASMTKTLPDSMVAAQALRGLNKEFDLGAEAAKLLQKSVDQMATGMGTSSANVQALTKDMQTLQNGESTVAQKSTALNDALDGMTGRQISLDSAMSKLNATIDQYSGTSLANAIDKTGKLGAALIDANGHIITTTANGRLLQQGFADIATAGNTAALQTLATSNAMGDTAAQKFQKLTTTLQLTRDGMIQTGMQMGLSRTQAEALATSYGQVPAIVATMVTTGGLPAAQAGMDLLRGKIIAVPDSKTVITSALTQDAITKLESLGLKVTTLPNGTIKIEATDDPARQTIANIQKYVDTIEAKLHIGADPAPATDTLSGLTALIGGTTSVMHINGETAGAQSALGGFVGVVAGTSSTMHILGEAAGAQATLGGFVGVVAGTSSTMHILGETAGASAALGGIVGVIAGTSSTMHINGESSGAISVLGGAVAAANSARGTMHIGASDEASGIINRIAHAYYQAVIHVVAVGAALGGFAGGAGAARGRIDTPSGVPMMAGGGIQSLGLSGIADVLPPGSMHAIIGDRSDVNESYIPWLPHDRRAMSLLEATAQGMGRHLAPRGGDGTSMPTMAGGGSSGAILAQLSTAVRAATAAVGAELAAEVHRSMAGVESRVSEGNAHLSQLRATLERRGAGANLTVLAKEGNEAETARATVLALRLT